MYKKKAPNENRTRYLQFTRLVPHHYGPGSPKVFNLFYSCPSLMKKKEQI